MKHMWSVASSILCLIAVASSATSPNGTVEAQHSVLPSDQVAPYNWSINTGALPENRQLIPNSTNTGSGALNGSLFINDNALDSPQRVAPSGKGVPQACIPPGGRCHRRGSCCPVSPPYHDICGAQGICIVE